jgi:hypothetical protein
MLKITTNGHKRTQFLIQPLLPPPRQSGVSGDKNVACLSSLLIVTTDGDVFKLCDLSKTDMHIS